MKHVAIKVAGADREPIDCRLQPGTTTRELLADGHLVGYLLSNAERFFSENDNLYPVVVEGDLLYATTPAEVG